MFLDEVEIKLIAGHGGAGKVSFGKKRFSGPDGGNGGKGGDVYILATADLLALSQFSAQKIKQAPNGENGGSNKKSGKDGEDLEIKLPLGSLVTDLESGESFEIGSMDQKILICQGGKGGRGNFELRSSRRTTPMFAQKGLKGQEKDLKIDLRLIADFGLIGLPNAGKSSLLNELTKANVKVANYPFTTLEPNLGVFDGKTIADIPGLIEGASNGRGLGIKFLKHIEKVKLLIHLVSAESENPVESYNIIREELKKFDSSLLKKREIVLLAKSDLIKEDELSKMISQFKKLHIKVLPVSVHNYDQMEKLSSLLATSKN